MQSSTKTTGFAAGEVSSVAAEPQHMMLSPNSYDAAHQHYNTQRDGISQARTGCKDMLALLALLSRRQQPTTTDAWTTTDQIRRSNVSKPVPIKAKIDEPQLHTTDSPSSDGMPGELVSEMPGQLLQRTEPDAIGSLVVLPNGKTARIERVEKTTRVIDGIVSPGGNTITRTRVVPSASIFRGMTRTCSVLSPESQPGATVMLPNGRMGVIQKVEVRRYPQVEQTSTVRPVHVTQSVKMLSPTSQPGAVIMLPNGRTATITRVETRTLPQVTADSATPRVGQVVILPNGRTATVTGTEAKRRPQPQTPRSPAVTRVEAALRGSSKVLGTRPKIPASVTNVRSQKINDILNAYRSRTNNQSARARVPTMPIRSNRMPTSPCSPRL